MTLDDWGMVALIVLSISTSLLALALLVSFIVTVVAAFLKARHDR